MAFLHGTERSPEVPEQDQQRVTELLNQYENGDQGVLPTRNLAVFGSPTVFRHIATGDAILM
jgi:hypothetical protein